jgi:serine/threonine protein kinase
MPLCPKCKQVLEANVRFCPHDGTPLTETGSNTVPTPVCGDFEIRPRSKEIELPTVVGGRYRLEEFRGGGGMAKVYKAIDITLDRKVAVKLINPELRNEPEFDARFQREARIASSLSDPHIVIVHDFGIDPEHGPFLVMEFLEGQSLREKLKEGQLPYKAGVQLGAQLLLALIHAHEKGIVHRDIKPDNIFLLNVSGVKLHVRVLDFGIARIYRRDDPSRVETLTHVGAILGTPRYMSPEQLAGQNVDARSDIYSAALVIHEAITSQLPYVSGRTLMELCQGATQQMQELLDHCLRPNPAERPSSALEVYLRLSDLGKASGILLLPPGALDKLIAIRNTTSDPTTPQAARRGSGAVSSSPAGSSSVPTEPHHPRRRLWLYVSAAALALVLVLLVIWRLFLYSPTPPGQEMLLGCKLGDRLEHVKAMLGLDEDVSINDVWAEPRQLYVGHVLRKTDFRSDGTAGAVQVWLAGGGKVCAIFVADQLQALVVRGPSEAKTNKGTNFLSQRGAVLDAYYPEEPEKQDFKSARGGRDHDGEVLRYDALGLGFEITKNRVTAISLYPPKPHS